VLWKGVPGSSMPAWHELSSTDLRALAAYLRRIGAAEDEGETLTETERGKAERLFAESCVNCHGTAARTLGGVASVAPMPTDFRLVRPTQARAEAALADGVPGTTMAPYRTKLDAAQRQLLARYVRSLYAGDQ
jgi:mono/diheme cytochrome c family protein